MRQEVYRVAYDEAHAELTEILGKFEQLRTRKDKIEKVVEALKPLLGSSDLQQLNGVDRTAAVTDRKPATPEPSIAFAAAESPASPIPYPAQQSIEPASDPFSRRADSVARDVQEYSRLFNTPATRGN